MFAIARVRTAGEGRFYVFASEATFTSDKAAKAAAHALATTRDEDGLGVVGIASVATITRQAARYADAVGVGKVQANAA
jgi:hypothetical protein